MAVSSYRISLCNRSYCSSFWWLARIIFWIDLVFQIYKTNLLNFISSGLLNAQNRLNCPFQSKRLKVTQYFHVIKYIYFSSIHGIKMSCVVFKKKMTKNILTIKIELDTIHFQYHYNWFIIEMQCNFYTLQKMLL